METPKIFESEYKFCRILWEHEPISTSDLVRLCADQLAWKRTTTYTVLKKLCNRGIFVTENSVVRTLISQDQFHAIRSEAFVQENFHGSLPAFLAAFTSRKPLTEEELSEIRKLMEMQ